MQHLIDRAGKLEGSLLHKEAQIKLKVENVIATILF